MVVDLRMEADTQYCLACGTDVVLESPSGTNLTPKGQKERAILALLAFSPQKRRTRLWLQDHLWSRSDPEKAAGSLRRALANIRKAISGHGAILETDKFSIGLSGFVRVDCVKLENSDEFLSGLVLEDATFEDWRRTKTAEATSSQQQRIGTEPRRGGDSLRIWIHPDSLDLSIGEAQFNREFQSMLSERLISMGLVNIDCSKDPADVPDIKAEFDTYSIGETWMINVRLYTGSKQFFLWSGRAKIPKRPDHPKYQSMLGQFSNVVLSAILDRGSQRYRTAPFFQLQHTVALLFTGQRKHIKSAESLLMGMAEVGRDSALVAGWRAFHRVTQQIEFPIAEVDLQDEGLDLATYALRHGASNPTVIALAAHAFVKLGDDIKRGEYLAKKALVLNGGNPYALSVAGHVKTLLGDFDGSYRLSSAAATAARALPNEFIWDMQLALASLGTGRLQEAFDRAFRSHLANMHYRPALRYLIALAVLLDRTDDVTRFERRLRDIEPGFNRQKLRDPNYPVDTLRSIGLTSAL